MAKKAEEANSKVKKYQSGNISTEEKISRFKYGRQSIPIALPEIAENEDEMNKPYNEGPSQYDYSQYKDDGLEFH